MGGERMQSPNTDVRESSGNVNDIYKKAKLRAMHLLERSDRSESALWKKLLENYPEDVAREAMDYVKSFGYINDARYAENYIRFRYESKSRLQIFQELQNKGVAREVIAQAWEEVAKTEDMDERRLIRKLLLKKYPSGSRLDEGQMRRLQGYLARRGFSWGDISAVLAEENIEMSRNREE